MSTLNLGILAHVDAGKTSLTERLLHAAGVIDEVGSVDDGSTQTDSLALERRRGITIKAAVVSFELGDITVNLIDTPGHPDFIAEVERVLSVLDGAVLVVSAVEGVQAQTRVLMRVLRRLGIPTLIFVNKIDRRGARYEALLATMADTLVADILPMGSLRDLGTAAASYHAFGAEAAARVVELLSQHDERILAEYLEDESALSWERLREELAAQTGRALVHPVFFGSAITGAGIDSLITGIGELLPSANGDPTAAVSGSVFKVERGAAGEKIAYVRMYAGTLSVRDRLPYGRVTGISVFERGEAIVRGQVEAGRIGLLRGLDVRIGDTIGATKGAEERHFAPPTLETVVMPSRPQDRAVLHDALVQLAEQDPLINVRQDERRRELSLSLYGEVQKEVIQATLAEEYAVEVTFRQTTTVCIERPTGVGEAYEKDPEPFLATVGLRVEPSNGVEFQLGVELGSMPITFFRAVEEAVRATLEQGLYGWQVTDVKVTMTRAGYHPRQSHAHATFDKSMSSTAWDFRTLTPLVLMEALERAGTGVFEPMLGFRLQVPADAFEAVLSTLPRFRATPRTSWAQGSSYLLEGDIPAANLHDLQQRLPSLTQGEGTLEAGFDRYERVRDRTPTRPRWDHNPLDRKEYLLHAIRRV